MARSVPLLVISEMALALVLVIGAALLIRTFLKLEDVDPGFTTHNVLTAAMSISGDRFQKTAPVAQIVRDGRERLMAIPGVLDAGASNCLPLEGGFGMIFDVLGRPKGETPFTGGAGFYSISWSYFSTFEIPVLRGRAFTEQDDGAAPGVVIINQAMARQYWPKGDPLKDRIQIGAGAGPAFAEPPRQVVGVVGDTRDAGVDRDPDSEDVHSYRADAGRRNCAQLPGCTALVDCAQPGKIRTPCGRASKLRCARPAEACRSPMCVPWPRSKCATRRVSASICCCSPSLERQD